MAPAADPIVVIKLGGSVLDGPAAFARAAAWLAGRAVESRLLVVVSAERGLTDRLISEARSMAADPSDEALALLLATGELRSVALLTLALRARGVDAVGLNVHEIGVRVRPGESRPRPDRLALAASAGRHRVAIAPGFLAVRHLRIVTLGRGGSDWSAVLLAIAAGAVRCELVKDVDGYYTADPTTDARARHVPWLDYEAALALAGAGCPLVQREALVEARAVGLPLTIRRVDGAGTVVSARDAAPGSFIDSFAPAEGVSDVLLNQNDSRRPAC